MILKDYKEKIKENLLSYEAFMPFPLRGSNRIYEEIPEEFRSFIIGKAEEYSDYQWPTLPASYYLDFYRNGSRARYEPLCYSKKRLPLIYLTAAEYIEGKGRFYDDIINGVWSTLDEASWVVPAHNRQVKNPGMPNFPLPDTTHDDNIYIDLFSAECAGVLSWYYYTAGKNLPKEAEQVNERLIFELRRRIIKPFMDNSYAWMGLDGGFVNNWNPWIISNVLTCCAFTVRNTEERYEIISKSLDCLQFFLNSYYPDGGCDEGPGYWIAAGASLYDCLEIISDMTGGRVDLCSEDIIKNICSYIYKMHINGRKFVNFADASPSISPDFSAIYRMGRRYNDTNMIKMASAVYSRLEDREAVFKADGCDCMIYRYMKKLYGYKALKEEKNRDFPLLRDVWFPGIEVMCARKAQGDTKGLYLAAKGGNNGESHNHNDVGSFVIYTGESPAVLDIGTGVYEKKTFSDRRYEIPQMQSLYHNLPVIGGEGQKDGKEFSSQNVLYSSDDKKAEFSLDIGKAYLPSAGIKFWKRSFAFLREEEKIILRDEFALNEEKEITLVLMVPSLPEKKDNTLTVKTEGGELLIKFDPCLDYDYEIFDTSKDYNLKKSWGDRIYRLKFSPDRKTDRGNYSFTFEKA